MDRQKAWEKLNEWVKSPKLIRHSQIVEQCMREAYARYGSAGDSADVWGVAGLLHDADFEMYPDEHPKHVIAWLEENGEHGLAHAIACHDTRMNMDYSSQMDKALLGVDELSGLITACAALRPDGIMTLETKSVLKKMKEPKFAAGVNRADVTKGAEMLTSDFTAHVQFVIDAIRARASEFGLTGKNI